MCRLCPWELFTPGEKAIVHVMNRTARRCFLLGGRGGGVGWHAQKLSSEA